MADPVWTDPVDYAVGHVVTADEWDALLGALGSLMWLRMMALRTRHQLWVGGML